MDDGLNATEKEVQSTILAFFETWLQPVDVAAEATLAYISDDFTGTGTGPGDYYPNRASFEAMLRREKADELSPPSINVPRLAMRVLRPGLALVDGQVRSEVQMATHTHVIAPRFSMVLEKREAQWLIVHMHFSVPDEMQDQGDTLKNALERRNRVLEREVKQRTAELEQSLTELKGAQTRLIQQEKLASLGRLTAGIAHEIKNPLNFVNNFAVLSTDLVKDLEEALAQDEPIAELLDDLKRNAEAIARHGQRADSIIKNMMAHARTSHGSQVQTPLNQLVREHVELAYHGKRAMNPTFSVTLIQTYEEQVGVVELVPQEIGRVVLNLLSNAFDAVADRDNPEVRVTTRRLASSVEVVVQDNGRGMTEDVQAQVFEPFFTTKPAGQGTGLGLSISYDIITQGHAGTMTVESEVGTGSVFIVQIPLT